MGVEGADGGTRPQGAGRCGRGRGFRSYPAPVAAGRGTMTPEEGVSPERRPAEPGGAGSHQLSSVN